jgi:hypothetical protein
MRKDYLEAQKEKKFVTLNVARAKHFAVDWVNRKAPRPTFLGTRVFKNVNLQELLPYIDWCARAEARPPAPSAGSLRLTAPPAGTLRNPFFQVWQLRGKYPNRNYPKIFDDKDVGKQAKVSPPAARARRPELTAARSKPSTRRRPCCARSSPRSGLRRARWSDSTPPTASATTLRSLATTPAPSRWPSCTRCASRRRRMCVPGTCACARVRAR